MKCNLSLCWHLALDHESVQEYELEQVLFELLNAIHLTGSVKQAAQQVAVSYRYAWGLFQKWEKRLGQPLLLMQRGRGTTLTVAGKKLLDSWQKAADEFAPALEALGTNFVAEFKPLVATKTDKTLNLFASNDLAITLLRDLVNREAEFGLELHFHGSLESLQALKEGNCDLAGFHIPTGDLRKKLSPQYIPWLSEPGCRFIEVVTRHQGLIAAAKNPKNIQGIHSLKKREITFINRQRDSGTRLLFDQLLQEHGISPEQINGYGNEEFTHTAVAALVASGAIDVGFGIAACAEKLGLEFIPVAWEDYYLAIPDSPSQDQIVDRLMKLFSSTEFVHHLQSYSGYNTNRSGKEVALQEIFSEPS